jgi:hypothetical protein
MATLIIRPIESLDAPELELYRTLRQVEEHERAGVACGDQCESCAAAFRE